jgi:hypothetical protein
MEKTPSPQFNANNFPVIKQKSMLELVIDSKNYMTIFGKMSSKNILALNMNMLKLDPLNPDSIL